MKICNQCGFECEDQIKFCSNCGEPFEMTKEVLPEAALNVDAAEISPIEEEQPLVVEEEQPLVVEEEQPSIIEEEKAPNAEDWKPEEEQEAPFAEEEQFSEEERFSEEEQRPEEEQLPEEWAGKTRVIPVVSEAEYATAKEPVVLETQSNRQEPIIPERPPVRKAPIAPSVVKQPIPVQQPKKEKKEEKARKSISALAVLSMIFSLIGLGAGGYACLLFFLNFKLALIFFIPSVLGIVFGLLALSNTGRDLKYAGKPLAIIGLIIGILSILLWVVGIFYLRTKTAAEFGTMDLMSVLHYLTAKF